MRSTLKVTRSKEGKIKKKLLSQNFISRSFLAICLYSAPLKGSDIIRASPCLLLVVLLF